MCNFLDRQGNHEITSLVSLGEMPNPHSPLARTAEYNPRIITREHMARVVRTTTEAALLRPRRACRRACSGSFRTAVRPCLCTASGAKGQPFSVCNDAGGDEKAVPVSRRTVCLGSHSPPTAAWPYHWKASTSLSSSSSWRWHSLLSPWPGCWYVRSSPHSKAQSECATSQSQFKKELGPTSNGSSAPS